MSPKPAQTDDDLLSIGEAAKLAQVSTDTLRRWDRDGRVRTMRTPTGHRRFRRGDVVTLMRPSHAIEADTETADGEAVSA